MTTTPTSTTAGTEILEKTFGGEPTDKFEDEAIYAGGVNEGMNYIGIEGIKLVSDLLSGFEDKRSDWELTGTVRIWHSDGWSPGFFTLRGEDGLVLFVSSYEDTNQ